jgi:hypothetical protein
MTGSSNNNGNSPPNIPSQPLPSMMPNPYPPYFFPSNPMYPPPFSSPAPTNNNNPSEKEKEKTELHVITLHPHGMPRPFDVPFPERRLPVCDKCKKNYKSRDLCRTRDGHKTLPWTTTYVAVTIDPGLIVKDEGGERIDDVPTIGLLMDTPLMCLGPADGSMVNEPICKVCREKNYTKEYCRTTCKHTTPPWNTTYVKIVPDTRELSERLLGYGNGQGCRRNKRKKRCNPEEDGEDGKMKSGEGMMGTEERENLGAFEASYEGGKEDVEKSDDLTVIHSSRTFLASVSSKSVIVRVSLFVC